MKIVIGSDHAGFKLKESIKKFLQENGHIVTDYGCYSEEPVDYPDVALLVAESVAQKMFDKGILIDGVGSASAIVANKVPGIRAAVVYNEASARVAAEHQDANIICLGARMLGELLVMESVKVFLSTGFEGGRHEKRIEKIIDIENKYKKR